VKSYRWLIVVLVAALVAAGCGRSDDEDSSAQGSDATTATTAAESDDEDECEGETLEATEVGVTADTITIEVMADVGSPLAPGLFQGNVDAMNAYAEYINDNGGIACRRLVVKTWDSKLSAEESKNGLIDACKNALALVGSNALFNPDVSPMTGCVDMEGNATGLPDLAALANDVNQQCAETTFIIQAVSEQCPVVEGERPLKAFVGPTKYYVEQHPGLHGIYMVPGDLPTTVQSATYQIAGQEQVGITWDATLKISGRDEQSAFTPRIQTLKSAGSTYVFNGSNDRAMINMRKEAKAQGVNTVEVWACSLACYTRNMLSQGGADVDGTYVWMQFLPFEEADQNDELKAYVDSLGESKVDSFGAQAWQAAALFKHVVDRIVEADGLNGITRARMLEELENTTDFTANGWMGEKDLRGFSNCYVLMQIQGGEFVRVHPEATGELDCSDDNVVEVVLDPAAEAAKIN
jgi:ABC-type branched-subunit amino acid transport system substrate-binding protein